MIMYQIQKIYFLKLYLEVSLLGYAKEIKSTREKNITPNYLIDFDLRIDSKPNFKTDIIS